LLEAKDLQADLFSIFPFFFSIFLYSDFMDRANILIIGGRAVNRFAPTRKYACL